MRVWLKALCAGALLAALGAPGAVAQDYESQVRGYLESGMGPHAERGYHRDRTIPDITVPLRLQHPYLWSVYLRAGENYRIYAACDNDCSDIDMEIYGADGNLVERDVAADDTPYVQITPAQSGRAYVRIWVYACENEPCYVAARVMVGGRPAERESAGPSPRASDDGDEIDSEYIDIVREELDQAGEAHESAGYARFGEDMVEPVELNSNGYTMSVTLSAGASYLFQGACDQDCSDVDMEILDPRGRQVALDVESDDQPRVAVEPRQSGQYSVRIWLAQCSVEPCYTGIRGYQRRRR